MNTTNANNNANNTANPNVGGGTNAASGVAPLAPVAPLALNGVQKFLVFCAGADADILVASPTEVRRFVALGAIVVGVSLLSVASGAYALSLAFRTSFPVAVAAGLFYGAFIFCLERLLLVSARKMETPAGNLGALFLRLGLAFLISLSISEVAVLGIFGPAIENQMTKDRAEARRVAQERVAQQPRFQEIETLREEIQAREARKRERTGERLGLYREWIIEIEGSGGSGRAGRGSVAAEKKLRLDAYEAEKAEKDRADDAEIRTRLERIRSLEADRDRELGVLSAAADNDTGLLTRTRTLHQMESRDPHLATIHLVLSLLILWFDITPVLTKTMYAFNKLRPYDEALETEENNAVVDAKEARKLYEALAVHAAQARLEAVTSQQDYQRQLTEANERYFIEGLATIEREVMDDVLDEIRAQQSQQVAQIAKQYQIGIGNGVPGGGGTPPGTP